MSFLTSIQRRLAFVVIALLGIQAHAADPLGLTSGVAADKILGALATPGNFDTSSYSGNIGYSSAALATRNFNVRLPSGYDPNNLTKKYGLVTFIDAGDTPVFPAAYAAALDAHDVIWIAPHGCGNAIATTERSGAAIMGAFRMTEHYNIDSTRIYASGLSGGSRVSSETTYLRNDFYRGFIGRVGAGLPEIIPNFSVGGNLTDAATTNDEDGDYEYFFVWAGQPSVVLPIHFRTALISQYSDFRRAEILGIYRYGHLNHGNTARMIMRPGGHSDTIGPSFTEALDLMYHPLVDVVWDRFENSFLLSNVQAGKTVAGSGFTPLSGTVSETSYSYNSATHGVLKLTGNGAAARSNDTFTWQNNDGILLDARLRGENAATPNQNQQIGLHIVPSSASGAAADQPGFHLYWCYGQPYRVEIVSADGVRKTLATWQHTSTHPMNLTGTDKTFWNDVVAPDYAGKMKSFRGEDVRVSLNSAGFQLTFNRPAANLSTNYPDKVVTATNVASIDNPAANPNESLPFLIQGFWSEVETALVNGLPSGSWRLALTNDAIDAGQACGNAVVDEIRVIGSTGVQAAPAILGVTAPTNTTRSLTWARLHGAMSYVIQRSPSPDGPFSQVASVSNTLGTYSDTVPSNIAYYYRVAAIGSDGATGNWSTIAFAKRTPSLPATPTSPAVTYPAVYQARIVWTDAASNETGYRVERSPAGYAQWSLVSGALPAGTTFFLDATVLAGAAYDYRVSAINADGLSGYASITANVPDAAPPASTGLAATPGYASVDLTWDVVPQAASYRIKRSNASGGPYTAIASGLASPAYADSTFAPGVVQYYVVSAVSGSGLLAADSAEISVITLILLPPTDFTVTPGFAFNTLSWSAATGATSYTVLRASVPEGPFETIASGVPATTFTDTGLLTGTTWFYQIRSSSGTVQSASTSAVGGTPIPGTSIKANNTTALDQAASWTNGIVPTVFDTARWDGTYTSGTMTTGAGVAFGKLQFASPSTGITINTGGALTLGAGGIDLSAATQSLTINVPVALAASQPWSIGTSRNVFLNQVVSDAGAVRGLTLSGPGGTVLAANNSYTGVTTLNGGTLHLGATAGTTSGSVAGPLTITGGTLRSNRTDAHTPIGGVFTASAGTVQVNNATGVFTLNSTNLPAASSNIFTTLTGVAGATFVVEGASTSSLRFGGSVVGMNVTAKGGNVTYTTPDTAFNLRIEGGGFACSSTSRLELNAASGEQTLVLAGSGRLIVPGILRATANSTKHILSITGGTLAAAAIDATNLRPDAASATGTLVQAGGTLAPGDTGTAGRTAITGNYQLNPSGVLESELGGTTQATAFQTGQYDYLTVSGTTLLAGNLTVKLINGFTPLNSTTFTILNSTGTLSGAFGNVAFGDRVTTAGGEGSFLVSKPNNTVLLTDFQLALTQLQSWRQTYFGTTANTGTAADTFDADFDGLQNLVEYALGTIPTSAASGAPPVLATDSNHLTLTFSRIADPALIYQVEAGSELAPVSWSTIWQSTGAQNTAGPVTVTDTTHDIGLSTPPRRFLRLRVASP